MAAQGVTYPVDIVLCIDATGSMGHIINRVKMLSAFMRISVSRCKRREKIDSLRLKVIAFRDYYADGEKSMMESRFFTLPEEKTSFSDFIHSVSADGGGDEPETGLEAIALAIRSDWATTGDRSAR